MLKFGAVPTRTMPFGALQSTMPLVALGCAAEMSAAPFTIRVLPNGFPIVREAARHAEPCSESTAAWHDCHDITGALTSPAPPCSPQKACDFVNALSVP